MSKFGFTIIELLVVISIMALLGTFAIANYRTFGEDKELESVALDIQSQVRTAQTNASTNLKCAGWPADHWKIDFYRGSGEYWIQTACYYINGIVFVQSIAQTKTLPKNIIIEKIYDDTSISCENTFPNDNATPYAAVIFRPLITISSFESSIDRVTYQTCNKLQVRLKNIKTNSTKEVIIDKGSRVYVQ